MGRTIAAGVAIGAAALVGLGAAAFALGSEFDSAYDGIAVSTGAVGEDLDALKDVFRDVVSSVPTDFATASAAVAELSKRTGETGPMLSALSAHALEFSRLFGGDVTENIRLSTRVLGDWGIPAEQMPLTLDKIAKASQLTGASTADLMGKVVQFGAPLRAMGFSLEESLAMLGKWEKEGVNTELVLGSMRIAMGKFADANIPMRKGLEDTMAKIVALGPGAKATSLAMETFGARAGPDMAAAILEGRFALGDLVAQLEAADGTITGVANSTSDGAEAMQLAFNKIKLALEPMAEAVFGFVGGAALDLLERFDGITTMGEGVVAVFGALGEAGTEAADVLREGLGLAIQWISEQGPVIAAQMQVWAKELIEWVAPQIPGLLETLGGFLDAALAWVVAQIPGWIDTLGKWGLELIAWIGPQIPPMITELGILLNALLDWASAHAPEILQRFLSEWVPAIMGFLGEALVQLVLHLPDILEAFWNWQVSAVPKVLDLAKGLGIALVDGMLQGFHNMVDPMFDSIMSSVRAGVNGVIAMINGMIDGINGIVINVPSVNIPLVGMVGGQSIGMPQIPHVPMLAMGGSILSDGLAFLHAGEMVVPASVASGGRSGGAVTFNNYGVLGIADAERWIRSLVQTGERRGIR